MYSKYHELILSATLEQNCCFHLFIYFTVLISINNAQCVQENVASIVIRLSVHSDRNRDRVLARAAQLNRTSERPSFTLQKRLCGHFPVSPYLYQLSQMSPSVYSGRRLSTFMAKRVAALCLQAHVLSMQPSGMNSTGLPGAERRKQQILH